MNQPDKIRKFLIATHGSFSAGVKSSLDMILGEMGNVFLIQAYLDGNTSFEKEIEELFAQLNENEELIIFSDILGGSVTNQLLPYAIKPNVHLLSGFNLPLLIDVLLADINTPAEEVITEALVNAKAQMVYVNELLRKENNNIEAENNNIEND